MNQTPSGGFDSGAGLTSGSDRFTPCFYMEMNNIRILFRFLQTKDSDMLDGRDKLLQLTLVSGITLALLG